MTELDEFTRDYITGALWSSCDNSDESGGEPFDANYSDDDLAPETLAQMANDCADFQAAQADDLAAYQEQTGYTGGVDFWLTRNGHGAGFWDRGLGALGDRLDKAAKVYSGCDLYLGDDGKIYQG